MEIRYSKLTSKEKLFFILNKCWIISGPLFLAGFTLLFEGKYSVGVWLIAGSLCAIPLSVSVELYFHNREAVYVPKWSRVHENIASRLRLFLELHDIPTKENKKSVVAELTSKAGISKLRAVSKNGKVVVTFRGDMAFPVSALSWLYYTRLVGKCLTDNGYAKA